MENQEPVNGLEALATSLIEEAVKALPGVREGTVMTIGPAPYRRLDADGRALAYIRVRPRKHSVRVDISGLWHVRGPSRLRVPSAGGSATLLIRRREDVHEALRLLARALEDTRAAHAEAQLPHAA